MRQQTKMKTAEIIPDPNQPRQQKNPEEQRRLNESVARHGILQPIGVRPGGKLLWGTSRLALKLSGASRDVLEEIGRKHRNGGKPTMRLPRVKLLLASGVCIVASGEALSLDDLIAALAEAGKEAKKAREQNLDVKTLQKVLGDKNKKGGA